jgi:hypothetical protein
MPRALTFWAYSAGVLLGSSSWADEAPNPLTDRFQVTLGTFFVTNEPTVQLDGDTEEGDRVDWDKKLGEVDATRLRLDGYWRFAPRHKVRAMAFRMSRENDVVLGENIDWGGHTYPLSAQVRAKFNFSVIEVAYEYAFLRRERYELDASFGLHHTTVDASLAAHAEESGGTLTEDLNDSARIHAPLPVIGLAGTWMLSKDFWLEASAQFFVLSIDPYNGHLENYRAALTWQPRPWLGLGIGYSLFSINTDIESQGWHGGLDWNYGGPMLFYRSSF